MLHSYIATGVEKRIQSELNWNRIILKIPIWCAGEGVGTLSRQAIERASMSPWEGFLRKSRCYGRMSLLQRFGSALQRCCGCMVSSKQSDNPPSHSPSHGFPFRSQNLHLGSKYQS